MCHLTLLPLESGFKCICKINVKNIMWIVFVYINLNTLTLEPTVTSLLVERAHLRRMVANEPKRRFI